MLYHIQMPQLIEATLVRRLNRFVAEIMISENHELAHVPSSGRMAELLVGGRRIWVSRHPGEGHKTTYRLLLVEHEGILVSVDATLPNRLVGRALMAEALPAFSPYPRVQAEFSWGHSRFDFHLSGPPGECLLEVKSVTLVDKGVALFPDAPTPRGTRHLVELATARRKGLQGAIIFVAQREDASCFSPNHRQDSAFAKALQQAAASGVKVLAYRCRVTREAVTLEHEIPVLL
ncbi:DNA/RNA nuclease SfsA [Desulfurispora thermophila]|uniref:DNA/RNA nuclease SfsA n=1 Tax=Desulfurispora thermophila TaxID=265470 RepID=UPI000367E185|nr:DNA/RNA nuclease SfsA [Desulfurispora thermophila]